MLTEEPHSMDPAGQNLTLTAAVLSPAYEGLVRLSNNGIEPLLATGWQQGENGQSWTFTLRRGVRFHDGTPLDAAAVVSSFRRLIDPGSSLAAAGKFKGVIAAVEALDEGTVRLRLKTPYTDILTLLATNQATIVSPKAAAEGTLSRAADGTGPYRFVSWTPDISVVERRNPDYWGKAPPLETIKWVWSGEASVLYMALRSGFADIVAPLSPIFATEAARDPALELVRRPGFTFFWIALDTRLPPFDDVRVRQALNLAVDRPALVSALLGGFGQPAVAPIAEAAPFAVKDRDHLRYDPAEARRLLAASGHGAGLHVAVVVRDTDEALAEALQAMWAKVGVTLDIRRLEGGVYNYEAFAPPEIKAADGVGGVLAYWASGILPELQLRPLFAAANIAPRGPNLGFFSDPEIDTLLDSAEAASAPEERSRLYETIQARILDQAPAVLLYTRDDLAGIRRGVANLSISPAGILIVSAVAKP